jgi:hypothetical protein
MQFGRRAYGAHRVITTAQKADNICKSILRHVELDNDRTLADCGVARESELGVLVVKKLVASELVELVGDTFRLVEQDYDEAA